VRWGIPERLPRPTSPSQPLGLGPSLSPLKGGEGKKGAAMQSSSHHDRRIHPGSGRRRGPDTPKGRQVDPAALSEVKRSPLLGEHTDEILSKVLKFTAREIAEIKASGATGEVPKAQAAE